MPVFEETYSKALRSPADRPGHVHCARFRRFSGNRPIAKNARHRLYAMNMLFERVYHLGGDLGRRLARFRGCSNGRTDLEQLRLNLFRHCADLLMLHDGARKSHLRNEFVDCSVAFDSRMRLRHANSARQSSRSVVSSFGCDAHASPLSTLSETEAS